MNEITIKAVAVQEHYTVIAAMMEGLHANERSLHSRTALWKDIEQSYMRHITEMQEDCEGLFLIAYVGGVPAGFIFGYTEEDDDSRIEEYVGKLLYVSDGFVYPEYRRLGIYHQLNHHLEKQFTDMGVKRICRYALANNNNMRALLEKESYTLTRVLYEKWL